jgi:hypothetical protein
LGTYNFVGFEVLTPVVIKSTTIFWNIAASSPLEATRHTTQFYIGFLLGVFTSPEVGGDVFL